jgi:phosphatidate cytidylyltransferase
MSLQHQTSALFAGVLGVLLLASVVGRLLAWRAAGGEQNAVIHNLNARIKAWWVMVTLIGLAFLAGKIGVLVLFAFASFTALREFLTLIQTRRGDH